MNKYFAIFANIVFVFMFFPYFTPINSSSDLQPWALIASMVFLCAFYFSEYRKNRNLNFIRSLPKPALVLGGVTILMAAIFAVNFLTGRSELISGLRVLFGYVSVIVFALFGFIYWKVADMKIFLYSVGIWFLAALAQLLFGAEITSGFMARFSTGGGRGLTSLASEPAFYAGFCASLILINEFLFRDKKYNAWWYIGTLLVLIAQVTLSYSGMGLVLLLLFASSKGLEIFFFKEDKKNKILAGVAIIAVLVSLSMFFIDSGFKNTRGGHLLEKAISTPSSLFSSEHSISYRLSNPVIAVYGGLVETKGTGFGVGAKETSQMPAWLERIHGESKNWGGRIEGGLFGAVYELGFIGLIYLTTVLWIVAISIIRNRNMRPVLVASAFMLFFPYTLFGSLAFPLFGFILGVHLYYAYKDTAIEF